MLLQNSNQAESMSTMPLGILSKIFPTHLWQDYREPHVNTTSNLGSTIFLCAAWFVKYPPESLRQSWQPSSNFFSISSDLNRCPVRLFYPFCLARRPVFIVFIQLSYSLWSSSLQLNSPSITSRSCPQKTSAISWHPSLSSDHRLSQRCAYLVHINKTTRSLLLANIPRKLRMVL